MGVTTLVVLDTNVFLHAKQFDEVDWPKLVGVNEVVLVVVAVVLGELDQQKWDHPSPHIKDKAKRITSAIGRLVRSVSVGADAPVRRGVVLRHIGRGPRLPPEIDPRNRDEVLQASIEELKTPSTRVLFLSLDENAALIARGRGTELLEPGEELAAPVVQPEQRQQTPRAKLNPEISVRGVKLTPNNRPPVEIVVNIPRKPTKDELQQERQRRSNLREAEKEKAAANWLRATAGRRQFGRGGMGALSLAQLAAAELKFLRAAETAATTHREKACSLASVIRVTNEGRGAAQSVTLEAFEIEPGDVGLTFVDALVTAISTEGAELAPFQHPQLLEGQNWDTKLTLELSDSFAGGVVKLRFALVCVELPRTVIEYALRVKVVESPPCFTG